MQMAAKVSLPSGGKMRLWLLRMRIGGAGLALEGKTLSPDSESSKARRPKIFGTKP
jgi:hypothetical protein